MTSEKQKPILKDTCLAAIVRDEEMNPAGGIVDFIDCNVPYLERAVIVDTGSVDRTREILEEAQTKHDNLEVYDKTFKGFANARNYSLKKARKNSKYALVLDADERLFEDDFEDLENKMGDIETGFNFKISGIYPGGKKIDLSENRNPRLFFNKWKNKYVGEVGEILLDPSGFSLEERGKTTNIPVEIKHFLPVEKVYNKKINEFYNKIICRGFLKDFPQLSECPSFKEWKQLNPERERYN